MKHLSVEAAFQWAQRLAAREWPLLLPVALAFFALPGLVVDVALPDAARALLPGAVEPGAPGQGIAMAALVAVAIINSLGALAITALALLPGVSVQEAIGRAARRLPALIGAMLLVSAAILLATLVLALLLGSRVAAPPLQTQVIWIVVAGGAVLWVRLALLVPLLADRGLSPAAALREAWRLTGANFWRLLGALALYIVGGFILLMAFGSATGVIASLIAGAEPTAKFVVATLFRLLAAVVIAGFQLVLAGVYRQLA